MSVVPKFTAPQPLSNPGEVTIAGPEIIVRESAEKLFDLIAGDPGAIPVQVQSGGTTPTSDGRCTSFDFMLSNHLTSGTIDDVVEEFSPVQVVITHQQVRAADQYNDKCESYVWAIDDTKQITLLDENGG